MQLNLAASQLHLSSGTTDMTRTSELRTHLATYTLSDLSAQSKYQLISLSFVASHPISGDESTLSALMYIMMNLARINILFVL